MPRSTNQDSGRNDDHWTKIRVLCIVSRMSGSVKIQWLAGPEDHDYPAAQSYLSLVYDDKQAGRLVAALKAAPVCQFKAKDIFRASGLALLGTSNPHVVKDRDKIIAGQQLSPILLIRDSGKVIIADGYHRLCAVYLFDEDAMIPCKIA
jgi:hypothetical protein